MVWPIQGSATLTPKKRGRRPGRSPNGKAKRGGSKRVLSFAMPSANVGDGDADAEEENVDADDFDGIRSRLHVYGNFDIVFGHFSRISERYTPSPLPPSHAPSNMLYLVATLAGC